MRESDRAGRQLLARGDVEHAYLVEDDFAACALVTHPLSARCSVTPAVRAEGKPLCALWREPSCSRGKPPMVGSMLLLSVEGADGEGSGS